MSIYVYRKKHLSLFQIILIYILGFSGHKIFVWGVDTYKGIETNALKFPRSSECYTIQSSARQHLKRYFDFVKKDADADTLSIDYFSKSYDLIITDYFAFEQTILKLCSSGGAAQVIAPKLLRMISNGEKPEKNLNVLFWVPKLVLVLLIKAVKDYVNCKITREKIAAPRIVYLRKKAYPDMGELNFLSEKLNKKNKREILGVYPFTSRKSEEYGFSFLNRIRGFEKSIPKCFFQALSDNFTMTNLCVRIGIDVQTFTKFWLDSYKANSIVALDTSILFGQLLDKPLYCLVFQRKASTTKMVSLNESFRFFPNRNFDYVYLDTYFSMNEIDERSLNHCGGNIREMTRVPFFRKGVPTKISDEMAKILETKNSKILVSTGQVFPEKTGYNFWCGKDLEQFVVTCLSIANRRPDIQFIFKEKKGEYGVLQESTRAKLFGLPNVAVVHSERPRHLSFDNLEALLPLVDFVISSTHISTVIWQAISAWRPVVAVNDVHPRSLLDQYEMMECNLAQLESYMEFWLNQSDEDKEHKLKRLRTELNIGSGQGLDIVLNELETCLGE